MRKILAAVALALSVASANAAASLNDSAVLSTDTAYQNRVQESLLGYCVSSVQAEGFAIQWHIKRTAFCAAVVESPASFKTLFAATTATDTSILADATAAGTVALTAGNVAAQAALVTDAHINNAVAAEFNTFLILP